MTVYLVGAGPGDPGLLTVRGAEVLCRADVVVHDGLADPALLDLAPEAAERIDVGERAGGALDQEQINGLLVEHGRAGREVVRLETGDPFVFGRGGEEALALAEAGVHWEVVPGVIPAVADPAYAGIPVTHRGCSTSVTVVCGSSRQAVDGGTDWEALASVGGTVIVVMGVGHRAEIARRLMSGGLAAETPVAVVTSGTLPAQTTLRTTLGSLRTVPLSPPATIVIGAVVDLDLAWYERRPLFGRSVVVTRARAQASTLVARLRDLGARPVELPAIRIEPPADGGVALAAAAARLAAGSYSWAVLTSANAVPRLCDLVPDGRSWAGTRIAAIGPATAAALATYRLVPDVVPERYVAESLLAALPPPGEDRRPVLLARAAVARDLLPEGLATAGWDVEVVEAYRTVAADPPPAALEAAAAADVICFTSSSTVTNYLRIAGRDSVPPVVACIGPVTAATARDCGLTVTVEAAEHTIDGLLDALVAALTS